MNEYGIEKHKNNLILPTIAFGLFIICFIIILAAYITSLGKEVSGWNFVFAVWISIIPLFISFILSIVSVIKYSSDEKTTGRKVLNILNWITIIAMIIFVLGPIIRWG